jgi:hypothetical protein
LEPEHHSLHHNRHRHFEAQRYLKSSFGCRLACSSGRALSLRVCRQQIPQHRAVHVLPRDCSRCCGHVLSVLFEVLRSTNRTRKQPTS